MTMNIKNVLQPSSKKIAQLSLSLKGLFATLAASAYVMANARTAFWLLLAGGIVDIVLAMLANNDEITPNSVQ